MRTFVIQSNRGVEQLVARRAHNPEAGGSSPSPATKKTDVEKSASVCRRMCTETGEMFHARYLVRVGFLSYVCCVCRRDGATSVSAMV